MPTVVVENGDVIEGADPASLWALVADPERVGEWAPVQFVGWMGREVPEIGHAFFATFRKGADPSSAVRFEIVDWAAGHQYRCSITRSLEDDAAVSDEMIEVTVTAEVRSGAPVARLDLCYSGRHTGWRAMLARWRARQFIDKALRGAATASSS